jgi:hypothetical protein
VEKPGVLTTSGRSKCNYHRWFINKHLIPANDAQFSPAWGGQGHWLFHHTAYSIQFFLFLVLIEKCFAGIKAPKS